MCATRAPSRRRSTRQHDPSMTANTFEAKKCETARLTPDGIRRRAWPRLFDTSDDACIGSGLPFLFFCPGDHEPVPVWCAHPRHPGTHSRQQPPQRQKLHHRQRSLCSLQAQLGLTCTAPYELRIAPETDAWRYTRVKRCEAEKRQTNTRVTTNTEEVERIAFPGYTALEHQKRAELSLVR